MSETERHSYPERLLRVARHLVRLSAIACLVCVTVFAISATSGCAPAGGPAGAEATPTVGAGMGGPVAEVKVTAAAVANMPGPWVLTSPESAVRSYLDWTAYAFRIGRSSVAVATMTGYEEVRVDSYIQYNIQKGRLIDQTLDSITLGKASVVGTRTILPAHEKWTYSYVSIETAGKVIEGPYEASYETTYTVVKSKAGDWVVDSVEAKALDQVK